MCSVVVVVVVGHAGLSRPTGSESEPRWEEVGVGSGREREGTDRVSVTESSSQQHKSKIEVGSVEGEKVGWRAPAYHARIERQAAHASPLLWGG
jgi:hypothetical protein